MWTVNWRYLNCIYLWSKLTTFAHSTNWIVLMSWRTSLSRRTFNLISISCVKRCHYGSRDLIRCLMNNIGSCTVFRKPFYPFFTTIHRIVFQKKQSHVDAKNVDEDLLLGSLCVHFLTLQKSSRKIYRERFGVHTVSKQLRLLWRSWKDLQSEDITKYWRDCKVCKVLS